jgi:uncharacterized protein YjiS (DUF1127 family)
MIQNAGSIEQSHRIRHALLLAEFLAEVLVGAHRTAAGWFAAAARARRRARARRELHGLSDRMLADIGLTRERIHSHIAGP